MHQLSDRSPHSPRPRRWLSGRLGLSLALSLLFHLGALLAIGDLWRQAEEIQAFRARLELPVRFQPRRLGVARPRSLPARQMEFMRLDAAPEALPEPALALEEPLLPDLAHAAPLRLAVELGARADTFAHPQDGPMPAPGDYGWSDTLAWEHLELLRIEDLARVEVDHAAVIEDPTSRRDLTGFVNLTPLRLYGAGSGNGSLDVLARYMRDHTSLLVQVRQRRYDFFESEDLLRDPIHFLVEGGGSEPYTANEIIRFSERERQLLGRYLRQGGFLFIEGGYRFLEDMAGLLREILGPEGQVYPLPARHPLYSAFYTFGSGFPGEEKRDPVDGLSPSWYYPANRRADQPTPPAPTNPNQAPAAPDREPPLGLWGVEVGGEVVAVLSDMDLHGMWSRSLDAEAAAIDPVALSLQAGTNIVVYALTRPGGITPKRPLPAWAETRPWEPVAESGPALASSRATPGEEEAILGQLAASLAVVRSPLGTQLGPGGVRLRVDGRYGVTILRPTHHGVLLRNLPAGSRWLQIEYGGKRVELAVDLIGGRVTTISLGVSRLAFLSRLRARPLDDRLEVWKWFRRFDDLSIDEVFLVDEEATPAAPEP